LETPKHPKYFLNVKNVLVCSNQDALSAMQDKAESLGFKASIESTTLSGNATQVGQSLAQKDLAPRTCFLFGGETTVEVKGGRGGRNQEVALSALTIISPKNLLVSSASDGWDNTDHAGAIADQVLLLKAQKLNINPVDYLNQSDSYNFFKAVDDGALCTGRLGSNVSDLYILLSE
jgi:glycerate-2-kinase